MHQTYTKPLVAVMLTLLCVSAVFAANNPGHDTLYVLKVGDSNVSGSINLTGNLTATLVQATGRFFGPNIDIRGDGTSSANPNQIIGTSTNLEISSSGNLILNKGVTSGMVYVGWPGTTTALNVTGEIFQQGKKVCLVDGTNCLSGTNTGNISSLSQGSGISITNPTGPTATIAVDTTIARAANCPAGQVVQNTTSTGVQCVASATGTLTGSGNGGTLAVWSSGSSLGDSIVSQSGNTLTINGNISVPGNFFIGGGAQATGGNAFAIGTNSYATGLQATAIGFQAGANATNAVAVGRIARAYTIGAVALGEAALAENTASTALGNGAWATAYIAVATGWESRAIGSQSIALGGRANASGTSSMALGAYSNAAHTNSVALGLAAKTTANNQLIIGNMTAAYNLNTQIWGTLNTSGTITQNSVAVCLADGTNCPAQSVAYQSSAAGWTNDSTTTSTSLNVNIGSGKIFANSSSGNLGIGTTSPGAKIEVSGIFNNGDEYFTAQDNGTDKLSIKKYANNYVEFYSPNTFYFNAPGTVFKGPGSLMFQLEGGGTSTHSFQTWNGNLELKTTGSSGEGFIAFSAKSVEAMRIVNGSKIGINTTNPQSTLEVIGSVNATSIKVGTTNVCLQDGTNCPAQSVAYQSSAAGWTNDSASTRTQLQTIVNSSAVGSFIVQNQTGDTHLFVNGTSGAIGMGIAAPAEALSIRSLTANTIGYYSASGELMTQIQASGRQYTISTMNQTNASAGSWIVFRFAGANNKITFGNNGSTQFMQAVYPIYMKVTSNIATTNSNPDFVVAGGGKVGINTTTPTSALQVTGDANITSTIWQNTARVCLENGTNCPAQSVAYQSSAAGWTNDSTTTSTSLNVGIGATPAGTDKLKVDGNLSISTDGSSTSSPRVAAFTDLSSGEAGRFQFGDPYTAFQSSYGGRLQIFSYWGTEIMGSRQALSSMSLTAGAASDPSLNVYSPAADRIALAVTAAGSQSANIQEWRNSGGSALAYISSTGAMYIGGSQVCTAANGLCTAATTDSTGGWTNTSTKTTTSLLVGIGATGTPSSVLEVANITAGNAGRIDVLRIAAGNDALDNTAGIAFSTKGTHSDGARYIKSAIYHRQANLGFGAGDLVFAVDTGLDNGNVDINDEKMRLTREGRLGLGITTPEALLQVGNNATATSIPLLKLAQLSGDPNIVFKLGATDKFTIGVDDSDGDKFKIGTTALETNTRLAIDASGNIGIGTAEPSSFVEITNTSGGSGRIDMLRIAAGSDALDDTAGIAFSTKGDLGDGGRYIKSAIYHRQGNAGFGYGDLVFAVDNDGGVSDININDEKMRLTKEGRLGLGTTAPEAMLQVGTNSTSTSGTMLKIAQQSGDPNIAFKIAATDVFSIGVDDSDGDKLKIGTSAIDTNTRITIDNQGKIGIGVTGPSTLVEIGNATANNAGRIDMLRIIGGNDALDNTAGIAFSTKGTHADGQRYIKSAIYHRQGNGGYGYGDLVFAIDSNGGNADLTTSDEVMRLTSAGRLGIGTSNPGNALEVIGTINATSIKVGTANVCLSDGTNCPASSTPYQSSAAGWMNDSASTRTQLQTIVNSSNPAGGLIVQNTTGGTHLFINGSSGYVGIGTTVPNRALVIKYSNNNDAAGTNGYGLNIFREYTAATAQNRGNGISFRDSNSYQAAIVAMRTWQEVDYRSDLVFSVNGHDPTLSESILVERMRITSTGLVGIGTASPTQRLDINGSINVSGASGTIYVGSRQVCLSDGTNCPAASVPYQSTAAGWTNSTTETNTSLLVNVKGTLRATGGVDQTAQGFDRLDMGVQDGSPRIVFENAGNTNWMIDNDAGNFRWYQPGQVAMQLEFGSNNALLKLNSGGTEKVRLATSGNSFFNGGSVGIGTTGPAATLHVNTTAGDLIIASNSTGNVFKVASTGEVFSDVAFSTPAADVAERIPVTGNVVSGEVVVIDPAQDEALKRADKAYDRLVAGIVSTKPGIKLGSDGQYIALAGRVPVKVTGKVQRGDLLVTSSIPGRAMACNDYSLCAGAVLGKALTNAEDGEVIALVSLQ